MLQSGWSSLEKRQINVDCENLNGPDNWTFHARRPRRNHNPAFKVSIATKDDHAKDGAAINNHGQHASGSVGAKPQRHARNPGQDGLRIAPDTNAEGGSVMAFFDELASLCTGEVTQALKDQDIDRASGVIADLSTMLGRSIARVAGGDSAAIDRLMTASENTWPPRPAVSPPS
ncbi:hypothetical protein [Paenirhodobacter populi]|uniref:Uncharacterized protein n=1 Tax=Paenirhodobacter populi TaxID=2306993 RepID=A0A443JG07_9RHOB|nr:hypothetical protein [Sinirhodobacter populi]RWR19486.1 hypothetical protein D2T30_13235 [Sinirhodobacter populi]